MEWALINKKETSCRKNYNCDDCRKEIPAGAYVKKFTFKKDDKYIVKKICENCEKYYRTKDYSIWKKEQKQHL